LAVLIRAKYKQINAKAKLFPEGLIPVHVRVIKVRPVTRRIYVLLEYQNTKLSCLQVKSMTSMRLSMNLRTLIETTSAAMWTNLEQRYGVPHFTGIYKDYEFAHSI
jgi:hypothetical protein